MIKPLALASYNWKVLIKSLICQILVSVLMLSFAVTVFGTLANDILRVISESNLRDFINATVSSIMNGSFNSADFTSELNAILSNLQDGIQSIRYPWGGATLSYILFFLALLVYRLFVSYSDVTVACQLEEFMTSNAARPFTWFLLKKQGKTWKFSCIQLLCTLPLDIIIVAGCLGIYILFLVAFGWWTIIPTCVLLLLLYTARQTFFAFCLPAVVCEDMGTNKAFKQGVSAVVNRFWHIFWKTLIVMTVMVAVTLVAIMYINNSIVCTAVVAICSFVLFFYVKCINIIEYFEANNRPYFYKRIVIEGTDRYGRKRARTERRAQRRK
ncbi:MAG: hypothetical protein NC332_05105 [Firmicutes bacterium]|nr:hypothetical protein [Bacillota bacterium]